LIILGNPLWARKQVGAKIAPTSARTTSKMTRPGMAEPSIEIFFHKDFCIPSIEYGLESENLSLGEKET
jgi:hypothetical protein